jgi:hypothetical protein
MINRNKPGDRLEGEKQGRNPGQPNAADETLIVDYVMLDFGDERFATHEDDLWETTTKPWRPD